ncbi:MAG: hypothetical protein RSB90_10535, partial [Eubacterium sp.]
NLVGGDLNGAKIAIDITDKVGTATNLTDKNTAAIAIEENGTVDEVKYVDASGKYRITIKKEASGTTVETTKLP